MVTWNATGIGCSIVAVVVSKSMSKTIGKSSVCRLPSGHFTLQCMFLISYIVYKLCDYFMIFPHAMFDCDKVLDYDKNTSIYFWAGIKMWLVHVEIG